MSATIQYARRMTGGLLTTSCIAELFDDWRGAGGKLALRVAARRRYRARRRPDLPGGNRRGGPGPRRRRDRRPHGLLPHRATRIDRGHPRGGSQEVVRDPRPSARAAAFPGLSRRATGRLPRRLLCQRRCGPGATGRAGMQIALDAALAAGPADAGLPAHQFRSAPRPPHRPRRVDDQPLSCPGRDLAPAWRADRRGASGL